MIINAMEGKQLPLYGDGKNIRDWLHVKDHCTNGVFSTLTQPKVKRIIIYSFDCIPLMVYYIINNNY